MPVPAHLSISGIRSDPIPTASIGYSVLHI